LTKIQVVVWNTKELYDVPDDLNDYLLKYTIISAENLAKHIRLATSYESEPIIINRFDALCTSLMNKEFTHVFIMANGLDILGGEKLAASLIDHATNKFFSSDFTVCGRILQPGNKSNRENNELFNLHEQSLLIDKATIDLMREKNFKFSEKVSFESNSWIRIDRSFDDVHDDYTPKKINAQVPHERIDLKKNGKFGTLEEFVQFCMEQNIEINNFSKDFRRHVLYTYHPDNLSEFKRVLAMTASERLENSHLPINQGQRDFFKKFHDTGSAWISNSEEFVTNLADVQYDCFVGVGAGLLPWVYLSYYNFKENSHVILIDINKNCLTFQKWFLESFDPDDSRWHNSWQCIIDMFLKNFPTMKTRGHVDLSDRTWELYRTKLTENWHLIKTFNFEFIEDDLITSSIIDGVLAAATQPMIWFSNILNYFSSQSKNYAVHTDESFLNRLLSANRNVTWIGATSRNFQTTGPGSRVGKKYRDISFYKPIDIAEFDVTKFLLEIQHLEDKKLFTKHRGTAHPGWSSFVIHGLGYDKTLDFGSYGHATNPVNLYHWTNEAMEYTPSIVKYFQNNRLKREYHRIRIMKLEPKGYIGIHDDANGKSVATGINIAVNNPTKCYMHFWTKNLSYLGMVPWRDGVCFELEIQHKHAVLNNSNETRYHIIVHGTGNTY
jgi:hypothetical protein